MSAGIIRQTIARFVSERSASVASARADLDTAIAGGDPEAIATARGVYARASAVLTALEVARQPASILQDP